MHDKIDGGALRRLRGLFAADDEILFQQFASRIFRETPETVARLEWAAAARDREGAAREARRLRDEARAWGAQRLVAHCEVVDRAAREGDDVAFAAAVDATGTILGGALESLESALAASVAR